jgi:predicted dehydrogenase/threonine dehydrogenase-like Zn-dependent dehydrogenase
MKQIIHNLNSGLTSLIEVPTPTVMEGHLLIQSSFSLVSSGTEKMLLDFGKANWLNKARQQPDRVQMVWDKIKTDGLQATIAAVKNKINTPIPLGYSNAGTVIALGKNVSGFAIGDRVVSNGAHAEIVQVPQNLAAKIPDKVSDEAAAFAVVGSIALQGIRLLQPSFGETVVVFGLGLMGQMAIQLLKANACKVIGIDPDANKCRLAESFGITAICAQSNTDLSSVVLDLTKDNGADAVLITAAAQDDSIISDAARMCRKRARIVLVGVVNLNLRRSDFYEKELSFQVSCSYGPGRYDYDFEKNGKDYPIGFVRWTAQRNFEAVLQAMASRQLDVEPLISQKVVLSDFSKVYAALTDASTLASLFKYDTALKHKSSIHYSEKVPLSNNAVALIGAGNFASKVMLPLLKKNKTNIQVIASAHGLSAAQLAKQFGIAEATTNLDALWHNDAISSVFIATQHHTHADLCIQALQAGKFVFVEKPLAINRQQLEAVKDAVQKAKQHVMVGFNRRYAPLALQMKELLGEHGTMNMVMTINAGKIPNNHWLQDTAASGGRIIGEVCHFIDLAAFLSGSFVSSVCTNRMATSDEDVSIMLRFQNGSTASIHYFSNGHQAHDKERIEVYSLGKTLILENWKRLRGFGFNGFSSISARQDKGHAQQFAVLSKQLNGAASPFIPFDSLYNTSLTAIAATESLLERRWVDVEQSLML